MSEDSENEAVREETEDEVHELQDSENEENEGDIDPEED